MTPLAIRMSLPHAVSTGSSRRCAIVGQALAPPRRRVATRRLAFREAFPAALELFELTRDGDGPGPGARARVARARPRIERAQARGEAAPIAAAPAARAGAGAGGGGAGRPRRASI